MKISKLSEKNYKTNFKIFVWHAIFLSLMKPFLDTDTIIPAMILKAGGNELLIGLATAILMGVGTLFQFFFGSYLSYKRQKKKHLIFAIFLRSSAILGLGLVLFWFYSLGGVVALFLIFFFIIIFAVAGAYGGVSYIDLIGKTVKTKERKSLFSVKTFASAIAFFLAALVVRKLLNHYDFPKNYSILYIIAFFLLMIASSGYYFMKEKITTPAPKKKFIEFLKSAPKEIKNNTNLKYYLLIVNTLGLSITAIPFLVSYAKKNVGLTNTDIGNFLLMKVAGMVVFSLIIYAIHKKINYKQMLIICIVIGTLIPVLAIIFVGNSLIYSFIFFLAGSLFAILSIAKSGIILEISTEKNRSEYAGIVGAGSILIAVLPLFSGFLLTHFGYFWVFIGISLITLSSLYFTLKLKCSV